MKLSDLGLRAKIMGGGMIPIALAAVLFIVALFGLRTMVQSLWSVDASHRTIRYTSEVQMNAMGMLAWLRGYILTGNERFAEEFKRKQAAVTKEFQELKRSIADNPELSKMVAGAEELFNDWTKNTVSRGVGLRQKLSDGKDMDDMAALVAEKRGEKYFGRFRELMKSAIDAQQGILEKLKAESVNITGVEDLRKAQTLMDQSRTALQLALEIYAAGLDMETGERGFLLTGKEESLEPYSAGTKRAFALLEKQKQMSADNPGQLKLVKETEDSLNAWIKEVAEPEIALRKQISGSTHLKDVGVDMVRVNTKQSFEKFDEMLGSFKEMEENLLKERQKTSEETTDAMRRILITGMVIVILASLLISYLMARAITRPLVGAVDLAERIGSGDLSRTLESRGKDEVGRLAQALNQMVAYLRQQAGSTLEGINVLASSAAEISATVAQLATSTSKTSSAVAETTTTVEQVKQAARVSSDKAKKVAESAQQAVQTTEAGKKATDDTVHRMNMIKEQMESIGETVVRLSEHSRAIEEIIGTVQDLADQSNLLAVNASIEAARAGDQGKGFAVVAHEIKTLADQSKSATEQVRAILEETRKWVSAVVMAAEEGSKAVEAGVAQSVMAGDSIQSLSRSVTASSQAASVIHTSTEQQFVGVDQVSAAMGNIEQAMQQNMAGTTQLESAAKRIEELGGSLRDLVARFKM